jgi:uncharacterized protein (TIGR02391 family)
MILDTEPSKGDQSSMAVDREALLQDLVSEVQSMRLCGPSDDPDEITAVSSAYFYLLTQLKVHASRILAPNLANVLRSIQVELNDIYSVYKAKAELDALLPDILDALEASKQSENPAVTNWYLEMRKTIREITQKSIDALDVLSAGDKEAARPISNYIQTDYQRLQKIWNEKIDGPLPTSLGRHVSWAMATDYKDVIKHDLPELEEILDQKLLETTSKRDDPSFEKMLHPAIANACYKQFCDGHLRDSVLNSIVAIFDLIRGRTGIDADGTDLANKAFSLKNPYLILSELETESGQSDQKGFLQIFNGSYQGIRNPKAHTLNHDLTEAKAAEYLVFASLLARRVEEAELVKSDLGPPTNVS